MEAFITFILADDKALWRSMIIQDLARFNITCIGEAANGLELLEQLKTKTPDVILLDLRMPVMDGNEAMQAVQKQYPNTRIIILSMHDEDGLIEDYMSRGARGFIAKDLLTVDMLVSAIRQVASEGIYMHRQPDIAGKYTARQLELIPMMCDGMTNKQIAKETGITEWGVEKQRQKIYAKTGSKRAADFYKYAFLQGLDFLGKFRKRNH